jgi:hypothetical protein
MTTPTAGPEAGHWTFTSLARQSQRVLERLMETGDRVTVEEVVGFEFRGWNLNPLTTVLRARKFKKGFYRDRLTGAPWGYNVRVRQGGIDEPWVALPSEEHPDRFYFFGVSEPAPSHRYPNALVIDYRRRPDNPIFVRYLVDYVVAPARPNRDLLLGKSYAELPFVQPVLGFFVLERHNPTSYGGPEGGR